MVLRTCRSEEGRFCDRQSRRVPRADKIRCPTNGLRRQASRSRNLAPDFPYYLSEGHK